MSADAQFVCQYCEKSFSSKGCLTTHTNTARSCLKRRGVEVPEDFKCILCEKAFFSQITLNNHARICMAKSNTSRLFEIQRKLESTEEKLSEYEEKIYQMRFRYEGQLNQMKLHYEDQMKFHYEDQMNKMRSRSENDIDKRDQRILELEAKIDQLNGKFQEIASQPRSVTNNRSKTTINNNNTLNLNDNDHIKRTLMMMKPEDLAGGQVTLARFVASNMLTNENGQSVYKCVDTARQNFAFVNEHGNPDKDVKCTKLTTAIVRNDFKKLAWEKGEQLWTDKKSGDADEDRMNFFHEKVLEVATLELDNSKFASEMTKLTV